MMILRKIMPRFFFVSRLGDNNKYLFILNNPYKYVSTCCSLFLCDTSFWPRSAGPAPTLPRLRTHAMEKSPSAVGLARHAVRAAGHMGVFLLEHVRCTRVQVHRGVQARTGTHGTCIFRLQTGRTILWHGARIGAIVARRLLTP